jgi:hypothetical protein
LRDHTRGGLLNRANSKVITKKIRKTKKRILAILAAATAIPVKPKMAAMSAITKNMIAHVSIHFPPLMSFNLQL